PCTPRARALWQATRLSSSRLPSRRSGRRLRARLARTVRSTPAPDFRAFTAPQYATAIDVCDHVAIAAKQCLRRAHFRACRELAFREPVPAVLLELGLGAVGLGTAGAERACVHLAAQAERA